MAYQKLGRDSSARKALFRDMVTDLFLYERIQTTEAKAKEVRSIAEKLITKAKKVIFMLVVKQLHLFAARLLMVNKMQFKKLFSDIAPRYTERPGGYTRILKLGPRRGDAAPMVYLELVDRAQYHKY